MIRKITRNNDYKDIIKSCPSGVIDDIYRIDYFVSGQPGVYIETTPEKVGNHLEVILSTALLKSLTYNGILMRRAYYKKEDPSYPDGYYNLEFVDNMEVWLGEEETSPFDPEGYYLTADDLKTINNQSIVGEGNIEISVPEYYATKSWVLDQGYYAPSSSETVLCTIQPTDLNPIVSTPLIIGNYTEGEYVEGVEIGAGGLTVMCHHYQESQMSQDYAYQVLTESNFSWYLGDYATQSWVSSNFLSTTALTGYATESWVQSQGYLTSVPSEYATQSWVSSQFLETSKIWTGTSSQWALLTPEQQAFYTIALVTE